MITVIRVLKYTYADVKHMTRDMERWTNQVHVPLRQQGAPDFGMKMESQSFIPQFEPDTQDTDE